MRSKRLAVLAALLLGATMLAGCCGMPNPGRWWDPGCGGCSDCCPIGDPCDPCDPCGCR